MAEGAFESRVSAKRETKSGIFITLEVQPADYSEALSMLRVGSAVQVGWAEIVDNMVHKIETDEPKRIAMIDTHAYKEYQKVMTDQARELVDKVRKPFDSLPLVQQCGIRCGDAQFAMFLMDEFPETASKYHDSADVVRQLCGVTSRAELNTNFDAAQEWDHLETRYQAWLTDKRYADNYR